MINPKFKVVKYYIDQIMEALAAHDGVYEFKLGDIRHCGICSHDEWVVTLADWQDGEGLLSTLIHELAHMNHRYSVSDRHYVKGSYNNGNKYNEQLACCVEYALMYGACPDKLPYGNTVLERPKINRLVKQVGMDVYNAITKALYSTGNVQLRAIADEIEGNLWITFTP